MKKLDLKPTWENLLKTYQEDTIGRNADLFHFISILNSFEDGYSLALEGNWGSGKTFFVKQVKMIMDAYNVHNKFINESDRDAIKSIRVDGSVFDLSELKSHVCVYYDAWENDNEDDPVFSLVYAILNDADTDFSFKEHSFWETAVSLMNAFTGKDWKQVMDGLKGTDPLEKIKQSKHIEELVREFLESLLPEHGDRLVVFVDELDRCKPSYAVRLLERIKHYFSDDRITFVFSVNINQLQHTIRKHYGTDFDASRYLDRFFDLRVALPQPDMKRFYHSIAFDDMENTFDIVCDAVIRKYHFELREVARYLQLTKIAAHELTHNGKYQFAFPEEHAVEFALFYIVPIMIGLKVSNMQKYTDFIEGRDYTPLLDVKDVFSLNFFSRLLAHNEAFDQRDAQKSIVKLESKLQDVYTAIWGTDYDNGTYSKSAGGFVFTSNIKEKLSRIVGLMSRYNNVNY